MSRNIQGHFSIYRIPSGWLFILISCIKSLTLLSVTIILLFLTFFHFIVFKADIMVVLLSLLLLYVVLILFSVNISPAFFLFYFLNTTLTKQH